MKYIPHILFSCLLIVILFGCQQTVFINQNGYEPRVAVECDIAADSLPKLYLTETQNYYGYLDYHAPAKYIETAKVLIIHNGIEDELTPTEGKVDTLKIYSGNGEYDTIFTKQKYYLGHSPIQKGETYQLKITYKDKETTSEMTVPNSIFPPAEIEQKAEVITYPGGWTQTEHFVEVRVKDPVGEGSFYRAKMSYANKQYIYDYNPITQQEEIVDSVIVYDKVLSDLISDEINDGGIIKLRITPYIYATSPSDTGTIATHIEIHCLDKNHGKYLESIFLQYSNGNDPFSEPTLLYSNIKGGVGFFGSYQITDKQTFWYKKGE